MRRFFLIALLAALVPLGCGGSDDGDKSATTQSTPESTQADGGSDQSTTDSSKSKDDKTQTTDDKTNSTDDKTQTTEDKTTSSDTGGGSTPSQSTGTTTKKAFIAKADSVCREFSKRLSSSPDPGDDADATVRLYRKVASQRAGLYRGFAALPKPSSNEKLLAQYEANLKKSVTIANQIADAIESNDAEQGPHLIQASRDLTEKNGKLAVKIGFRVCRG